MSNTNADCAVRRIKLKGTHCSSKYIPIILRYSTNCYLFTKTKFALHRAKEDHFSQSKPSIISFFIIIKYEFQFTTQFQEFRISCQFGAERKGFVIKASKLLQVRKGLASF